ncbi:MAG: alpha/beta hydrolase [Dehalococcoidia bacterium]
MPQTRRSGLRINYKVIGSGPPVVLVHGYTASGHSNWIASGWPEALAGRNTLLIPDLRGHGRSEKPHSADRYSLAAMAADVLAVMDEEGVERPALAGYSMGGLVTMNLLLTHPERVSAAVIGAMGSYFPKNRGRFSLERQDKRSEAPRRPLGQQVRFLAGYVSRFDPLAIDAVYRGVFKNGRPLDIEGLKRVTQPVLVAAGTLDPFYEPAKALAAIIPGSKFVPLPYEGHISAVRSPRFKDEVSKFLQGAGVAAT